MEPIQPMSEMVLVWLQKEYQRSTVTQNKNPANLRFLQNIRCRSQKRYLIRDSVHIHVLYLNQPRMKYSHFFRYASPSKLSNSCVHWIKSVIDKYHLRGMQEVFFYTSDPPRFGDLGVFGDESGGTGSTSL